MAQPAAEFNPQAGERGHLFDWGEEQKRLAIALDLRFDGRMTTPTPTMFRLLLGVSSKRASRSRWLWSTRVAPLGSQEKAPVFQTNAKLLEQSFGAPCSQAIEAQVPKAHIPGMASAMHLALAMRLRAQGDQQGAEAIEQVWSHRRATAGSR